jgi:hypothetical protein
MEQGYIAKWQLEDNNGTSEYLSPLVSILAGDYENLQNAESEFSAAFEQFSDYDFSEPFVENPYIRPPEPEIDIETKSETEIATATEEEVKTTTDQISSNEIIRDDDVEESKSIFKFLEFMGSGSNRIFLIIGLIGVFGVIGSIIYSVMKWVKKK